MNYRHAYHAGNFADVHKHTALVATLLHLRRKESPFAVIDTHAGGGLYDISAEEAQRTREANDGIATLRSYAAQSPALAEYLEIVRGFGNGALRAPATPMSDSELASAISDFLKESPSAEAVSSLGRRFDPSSRV